MTEEPGLIAVHKSRGGVGRYEKRTRGGSGEASGSVFFNHIIAGTFLTRNDRVLCWKMRSPRKWRTKKKKTKEKGEGRHTSYSYMGGVLHNIRNIYYRVPRDKRNRKKGPNAAFHRRELSGEWTQAGRKDEEIWAPPGVSKTQKPTTKKKT